MSDHDFYSRVNDKDLFLVARAVQSRCTANSNPSLEACLDAVLTVLDGLRSTQLTKARFMARLTDHAYDALRGQNDRDFHTNFQKVAWR